MSKFFVVMPPGTGKSYLHNPQQHIVEADTLVPNKSTETLRCFRRTAKVSGDWSRYDRHWSQLVDEASSVGDVILIPTHHVAETQSWIYLGHLYLEYGEWLKNIKPRGQVSIDCHVCYHEAVDFGIKSPDNEHTLELLHKIIKEGKERHENSVE